MKQQKVILTDIQLNIEPTMFEYHIKWVDSKDIPDCGYYENAKKPLDYPKLRLTFDASTDIDLIVGAVYMDNKNLFKAIAKNRIVNINMIVDTFTIPSHLTLLSNNETL